MNIRQIFRIIEQFLKQNEKTHAKILQTNNIPDDIMLIIYQYYVEYLNKLSIVYVFDDIAQDYSTYIFGYTITKEPIQIMYMCRSTTDHKNIALKTCVKLLTACRARQTHYEIYIMYKHINTRINVLKTYVYPICDTNILLSYGDNNVLTTPYFTHDRHIIKI